jgi:hypothetical protein
MQILEKCDGAPGNDQTSVGERKHEYTESADSPRPKKARKVNSKVKNNVVIWSIYFTHRNRLPDSLLTLNWRNIQFVDSVKYLGVIFDKRMTWRLHIQIIEAKAFRTFIRLYPYSKVSD